MNYRQQRGLIIAKALRVKRRGVVFKVGSDTGKQPYTVDLSEPASCTCPDNDVNGKECKHIWAARYYDEYDKTGAWPPDPETPQSRPRPTYKQNWPVYNLAQSHEKERFRELLRDLCLGVQDEPGPRRRGRPRIPIRDAIFAAVYKVYSTASSRRFMTDLRDAQSQGFVGRLTSYNAICSYLQMPTLLPVLKRLVEQSSLPLKTLEIDFTIDSTGFTSSRMVSWFDKRYGVVGPSRKHDYTKVSMTCGVLTKIVTAIEVTEKDSADAQWLPPMIETTAKNFKIRKVMADKAYSTRENLQKIADRGAMPYIPFRGNTSETAHAPDTLWMRMYYHYKLNREEFLAHYHKRSNSESLFSMIKAKFRDHVRSKGDVSMKNEVLCKVVCHNICRLIHSIYESGLIPNFWAGSTIAPKIG